VRRETFEEAGVTVGRVRYFASQPWPFPMSLMIGCHAQASAFDLKIDRNELEDGRWFTRAEAAQMLARKHPNDLFVPPPIAIAHHLIRAYVEPGRRLERVVRAHLGRGCDPIRIAADTGIFSQSAG
jgi:NAD+ diphosphatase